MLPLAYLVQALALATYVRGSLADEALPDWIYHRLQHQPCDLPADSKTVISNIRAFDGQGITDPQTVVIDGCIIGSDPAGAQEDVDGTGLILIPGLIDSHVHPVIEAHLEAHVRNGVTTMMNLATQPASNFSSLRGLAGLSDVHSTGHLATVAGSHHAGLGGMDESQFLSSAADVPAFLDARVAEGSEFIKIASDEPGPTQEMMDALVAGAEERGLLTACHAATLESYRKAARAGVSQVHHVPYNGILLPDEAALFRGKTVCPTLSIMEGLVGAPGFPPVNYSVAEQNFIALMNAGAVILAGSDANDLPVPENPKVATGDAMHHELELMTAAGLSNLAALRSATVVASKLWGFQDRGEIQPGMRADLVLLRENPLEAISALRSIERVWVRGHAATLPAKAQPVVHDEL